MSYEVVISREAEQSILRQARFIWEDGQSPQNAEHWLESILDAVESLENYPRRCPVAGGLEGRMFEVRMLAVGGFLLFFDIDESERVVTVISARHGRQLGSAD